MPKAIIPLLISFFVLLSYMSNAQTESLGSWNTINLRYLKNEKWSVFAEAQLRSLMFYTHFHYYEYKFGANYKPSKYLDMGIGAGSYQTYLAGGDFVLPKKNNEFRMWSQIVLSQVFSYIKIEHRYRAEFRFTSNGYRNRGRYRLSASLPFGSSADGYRRYQIALANEIFFFDYPAYFERNRISCILSYKPTRALSLQAGYLYQFDYQTDNETGRNFLQLGIFIDIFSKKYNAQNFIPELKEN